MTVRVGQAPAGLPHCLLYAAMPNTPVNAGANGVSAASLRWRAFAERPASGSWNTCHAGALLTWPSLLEPVGRPHSTRSCSQAPSRGGPFDSSDIRALNLVASRSRSLSVGIPSLANALAIFVGSSQIEPASRPV